MLRPETVEPYVRLMADRLTLRDWTIEVSSEAPEIERAYASCEPIPGRRFAILRFDPDFYLMSAEWQRYVVVHELLHCHVAPLYAPIERDARELLAPDAHRVLYAGYSRAVEYVVDALASAVAPHLPLPGEGGEVQVDGDRDQRVEAAVRAASGSDRPGDRMSGRASGW